MCSGRRIVRQQRLHAHGHDGHVVGELVEDSNCLGFVAVLQGGHRYPFGGFLCWLPVLSRLVAGLSFSRYASQAVLVQQAASSL